MCLLLWCLIWTYPVWWVYDFLVVPWLHAPQVPVWYAFVFNIVVSLLSNLTPVVKVVKSE